MAEYIEKEALMAKIDAWEESARNGTNPNCKNGNEYEAAMDIAIMVEEAPAASVRENVKGEWLWFGDCSNAGLYCSVCRNKIHKVKTPKKKTSNFCPNCGADMTGGNDGQIRSRRVLQRGTKADKRR